MRCGEVWCGEVVAGVGGSRGPAAVRCVLGRVSWQLCGVFVCVLAAVK